MFLLHLTYILLTTVILPSSSSHPLEIQKAHTRPVQETYVAGVSTRKSITRKPTPTKRIKLRPVKIIKTSSTKKVYRTPKITKSAESPTPTTNATFVPTTSVQDFIMYEINEYRKSQGLSEVKTDQHTCDFAKIRAEEIKANFNHDGFRDRINNKTLPYPSYSSITENIAMTSDYKEVVDMWINSSGHAENMRKDTPFVCVEQSGNYYAYEGWKP